MTWAKAVLNRGQKGLGQKRVMAQRGFTPPRAWPEVFYGWYIVAAAFVVMTVSSGFGFYNLGVYLNAFVEERSFPVGVTSSATATFFLASGFAGLAVGRFIEHYDLRWSVVAGATISGLTLYSAPLVDTLWELYAFHILFGIGYAACALLPCTTIVTRWFDKQRPVALSVASTGLSIGGVFLTPLSIYLIDLWGMSGAGPVLGTLFFLGVAPIAILLFRGSPESMGLSPDGYDFIGPRQQASVTAQGVAYDDAIRSRFFLFMTAAFFFAMMAQVGVLAHHFRLVSLRTESTETASFLVAALATASIVGRLIGGQLLSRFPSRGFVLLLMATQSFSLVMFSISTSSVALFAATLVFGATVGSLLMMQPLLVAERFGLRSYGRIFSANNFLTMFGVASGPAVVGILYSSFGGYGSAYLVMAGASAIAYFLFFFADGVRPRSNDR